MSERSFSVRDTQAVVDFVEEAMGYLSPESQREFHVFLETLEIPSEHSLSYRAEQMKRLAIETWPMRRALKLFLEGEGGLIEWKKLIQTVRPTTALLLTRLQKTGSGQTLDEVLALPGAYIALQESEEIELRHVRPEIRLQIWREMGESLTPLVQRARQEFRHLQLQLQGMRREAEQSLDDREKMLERVESLEHTCYVGGQLLHLEQIDG